MPAAKTLTLVNDATEWIGHPGIYSDAVFQITGTWTGTVTFECCTQGNEAAPTPIAVSAVATPGTLVTTATANGVYRTNNGTAGGLKVRARYTTATSPSPVVTAVFADGG